MSRERWWCHWAQWPLHPPPTTEARSQPRDQKWIFGVAALRRRAAASGLVGVMFLSLLHDGSSSGVWFPGSGSAGEPVDLADLFVEDAGGHEAAQGAHSTGRDAGGVSEPRFGVGDRCDDDLRHRGRVITVVCRVSHYFGERLPLPCVCRDEHVGSHHGRVERRRGGSGLDEHHQTPYSRTSWSTDSE